MHREGFTEFFDSLKLITFHENDKNCPAGIDIPAGQSHTSAPAKRVTKTGNTADMLHLRCKERRQKSWTLTEGVCVM